MSLPCTIMLQLDTAIHLYKIHRPWRKISTTVWSFKLSWTISPPMSNRFYPQTKIFHPYLLDQPFQQNGPAFPGKILPSSNLKYPKLFVSRKYNVPHDKINSSSNVNGRLLTKQSVYKTANLVRVTLQRPVRNAVSESSAAIQSGQPSSQVSQPVRSANQSGQPSSQVVTS